MDLLCPSVNVLMASTNDTLQQVNSVLYQPANGITFAIGSASSMSVHVSTG
jgi:hypothetical protein